MLILPSLWPTATQCCVGCAVRHVILDKHCRTSGWLLSWLTLCRYDFPELLDRSYTVNSLCDVTAATKSPCQIKKIALFCIPKNMYRWHQHNNNDFCQQLWSWLWRSSAVNKIRSFILLSLVWYSNNSSTQCYLSKNMHVEDAYPSADRHTGRQFSQRLWHKIIRWPSLQVNWLFHKVILSCIRRYNRLQYWS